MGEASQRVRGQDPSEWLILAVVVAFLGVFLALTLFVLYRRKSTSHNRQLRYLKAQMNSIEMRVAQECKVPLCHFCGVLRSLQILSTFAFL